MSFKGYGGLKMTENKKGAELREQSNTNCNPRSSRKLQGDFNAILQEAQSRFVSEVWQGAEVTLNGSQIAQEFEEAEQAAYDALKHGKLDANGLGRLVGACAIYWAEVGKLCIEGRL